MVKDAAAAAAEAGAEVAEKVHIKNRVREVPLLDLEAEIEQVTTECVVEEVVYFMHPAGGAGDTAAGGGGGGAGGGGVCVDQEPFCKITLKPTPASLRSIPAKDLHVKDMHNHMGSFSRLLNRVCAHANLHPGANMFWEPVNLNDFPTYKEEIGRGRFRFRY
jgi:hypothetical protein